MRSIINVSLPATTVKEIKKEVKVGGYASTSEFIRHLLRLWNTKRLADELRHSQREFEAGKGKLLRTLADLD